jgi:YegS/Rv2252/BmrU family lipid kinase
VNDPDSAELYSDAPFRRALVVANPIAGRGHGRKVGREVVEGLKRLGVPAELFLTEKRGDGRARVRCLEPEADLVVSVGGDGTLREVFDGLVDPDVVVGAVPMGTANVLSLDLGLPRDVDGALEVMAGRKTVAIDLAQANGHVSFLVTGVGLDGMTVREVERRRDGPITKWSYPSAILRALREYEQPRLRVELEGERVKGEYGLVLISNIVNYGGFLKLCPDRKLDDGRYEVFLFEDAAPRHLIATAVRGALTGLAGHVRMELAREARVTSDEPVPYQVDGDYRGETPLEFAVTDRQVRLLVP